eukprot:TRINITY_DN6173_c0_g1_i1.p1 TRINITY_DN6173_c0_g1~~TRINITY_DN6173_c0_g1_i1.p1  ORF type:complete len:441 (+),score=76.97 TRINITY_DN6173_c0_g1_i1:1-1323(+)
MIPYNITTYFSGKYRTKRLYRGSHKSFDQNTFNHYLTLIHSARINEKIEGITYLRTLLSQGEDRPPVSKVMKSGVIDTLVGYLESSDERVVLESTWTIRNLCGWAVVRDMDVVVSLGVPERFKGLLYHPNEDVREQALWGLGNIAEARYRYRDYLLSMDVLLSVAETCRDKTEMSFIRTIVWTISNLCSGHPFPDWDKAKVVMEIIPDIIKRTSDSEILTGLGNILYSLSQNYELVVKENFIDILMELLSLPMVRDSPTIAAVKNITRDNTAIDLLISKGVLPLLKNFLSTNTGILDTLYSIGNITQGTDKHIGAVVREDILPIIIDITRNNSDQLIKGVVLETIRNVTAIPDQVDHIVSIGGIETLCSGLEIINQYIISAALEGILNIVRNGIKDNGTNPYAYRLMKCGIVEKFEFMSELPGFLLCTEESMNQILKYCQ